jgi:ribonuclease D
MLITTEQELNELMQTASQAAAVALDTEFVWERTFYPALGLIQMAIGHDVYLIDPLAIKDMSTLGDLIANPKVIKILHDAQQDLTILKSATGANPVNIFDSRLAYGFCCAESTLSLAKLVEAILGITLDKSATRTNWLQRPLDQQQLIYAADDVKYLTEVMDYILTQAEKNNTKNWLLEEMTIYENPELYTEIAPTEYYRKIRNTDRLKSQQLAILRELASWRETVARKLDRPRGHIIHNNTLIDMAYRAPGTIQELKKINRLSSRAVDRYGKDLINCIENASKMPVDKLPMTAPKFAKKSDAKLIISLIEAKATAIGLDPALLCSRKEINNILINPAKQSAKSRIFKGWRHDFMQDIYQNSEVAALMGICL